MDQHCALQPRANQERRHRRQDCVQEEPGETDQAVPEGGAGEAAQLSEGEDGGKEGTREGRGGGMRGV